MGQATRLAIQVSDRLAPYRKDEEKGVDPLAPPVPYPADKLGERLSRLAGLLSLPLGIRGAALDADVDFDTHDNQPSELAAGLAGVSGALAAFQADLEARG